MEKTCPNFLFSKKPDKNDFNNIHLIGKHGKRNKAKRSNLFFNFICCRDSNENLNNSLPPQNEYTKLNAGLNTDPTTPLSIINKKQCTSIKIEQNDDSAHQQEKLEINNISYLNTLKIIQDENKTNSKKNLKTTDQLNKVNLIINPNGNHLKDFNKKKSFKINLDQESSSIDEDFANLNGTININEFIGDKYKKSKKQKTDKHELNNFLSFKQPKKQPQRLIKKQLSFKEPLNENSDKNDKSICQV